MRTSHGLRLLPPAVQDSGFGLLSLIVGDRDDGRLDAQVPSIVFGADGNRIGTAILIIPVARGLQASGEGIAPVHEGNAATHGGGYPLLADLSYKAVNRSPSVTVAHDLAAIIDSINFSSPHSAWNVDRGEIPSV